MGTNTEYMREYMRRRRAAGLDKSRSVPKHPRKGALLKPIDERGLSEALSAYSDTMTAKARSEYLNGLLRQRFASILGDKDQAPQSVVTGGDRHRASLHVGSPFTMTIPRDREPDPQVTALREYVEEIFSDLPDLIAIREIIGRLPSHLTEGFNRHRVAVLVGRTLRALGAATRDIGNSSKGTVLAVHILRNHDRYGQMKRSELEGAFHDGRWSKRPRAVTVH